MVTSVQSSASARLQQVVLGIPGFKGRLPLLQNIQTNCNSSGLLHEWGGRPLLQNILTCWKGILTSSLHSAASARLQQVLLESLIVSYMKSAAAPSLEIPSVLQFFWAPA